MLLEVLKVLKVLKVGGAAEGERCCWRAPYYLCKVMQLLTLHNPTQT